MTIAPVPQVGRFQSCMELLGSPTTYLLTENNLVSHSDDRLSCLFKPCDWEQLRLHACADNISRCLSSSFPVSDLCPASISPAAAADFHQLWFYAEDIFIRVLFKGCKLPVCWSMCGKIRSCSLSQAHKKYVIIFSSYFDGANLSKEWNS